MPVVISDDVVERGDEHLIAALDQALELIDRALRVRELDLEPGGVEEALLLPGHDRDARRAGKAVDAQRLVGARSARCQRQRHRQRGGPKIFVLIRPSLFYLLPEAPAL